MASEHAPSRADITLTASGIARLAGVGRAAVSNWRRRYADFPAPVGGPLSSPIFNAHEVEEWLDRRGKLPQVDPQETIWRHIESYRPATQIGDALGIAGAYLLARRARPDSTNRLLTPKQLTSQLRALDRDLTDLVRDKLPERWNEALTAILQGVDELARIREPEKIFEYLHGKYLTSAQSMSGLAGTPDTVAEVMLNLAGHGGLTFDFTCGTGSILRMAADRAAQADAPIRCLAQEINPEYALIAAIRLWFVHLRADTSEPPAVHVDGSLLADAYTDLRADVVVANFPFGIHDWGHEQLAYDPRWVYGVPPRTEPELAWVQHALAHLAPGGTAVVLMPPAAAARPAGRRIRAELVRRGTLRAVIALPAGLMPPAGIGLHVWALVQPHETHSPPDDLLFVDAATGDQPIAKLGWTVWQDYRNGTHTDMAGVHRTIPAIDILDDQVDLTPQRYLESSDTRGTDPARIIAAVADFDRQLTEIREQLPTIQPAPRGASATPQASLGDLVRAGSMTLLRAQSPSRSHDAAAAHPALTVADILAGRSATATVSAADDDELIRVSSGDILISLVGREVVARVATDNQVGTVAGPGMQILRIDPDRFDPWFVASVLTYDSVPGSRRTSSGSSGGPRIDLRRLAIPVLALAEQQRFGRAFRQLADFRAGLERVTAMGSAIARDIGNGLMGRSISVHDRPSTQTN